MDMDKAVEELQQELKLLKNEIQETLIDVREHLLNTADSVAHENPAGVALALQLGVGPGSAAPGAAAPAPAAEPDAASAAPGSDPSPDPKPVVDKPEAPDEPASGPRLGPARGGDLHPRAKDHEERENRGGRDQGRPSARAPKDRRDEAPEDDRGPPSDAAVDLVTVVSLGPWLEAGVRRMGRKRVKSLLDVYAAIGGISTELRDVLVLLVSLDDTATKTRAMSVGESLGFLVDLDDVLWRGRQDWRRAMMASMVAGARAIEDPDEDREAA